MAKIFKVNDFIESNAKGMVKVYEVEGAMDWTVGKNADLFEEMLCGAYDVYDCTPGCLVITSHDCLKFNSMTDYHETDDDAKLRIISVSDDKWYHELFEDFIAHYYEGKAVKVHECERTSAFTNEVTDILKKGFGGEFFTMEQSPFVAKVTIEEDTVSLVIDEERTEIVIDYVEAYSCEEVDEYED